MKILKAVDKFSDEESVQFKKELAANIKILEAMKKELSNLDEDDKKEVFENFVMSQFTQIDQEERTAEEISKKHALALKQVSLLI